MQKNPTTYMVKHITIFLLALIVHTQIFVPLGHAQNFRDMYGNSKVSTFRLKKDLHIKTNMLF